MVGASSMWSNSIVKLHIAIFVQTIKENKLFIAGIILLLCTLFINNIARGVNIHSTPAQSLFLLVTGYAAYAFSRALSARYHTLLEGGILVPTLLKSHHWHALVLALHAMMLLVALLISYALFGSNVLGTMRLPMPLAGVLSFALGVLAAMLVGKIRLYRRQAAGWVEQNSALLPAQSLEQTRYQSKNYAAHIQARTLFGHNSSLGDRIGSAGRMLALVGAGFGLACACALFARNWLPNLQVVPLGLAALALLYLTRVDVDLWRLLALAGTSVTRATFWQLLPAWIFIASFAGSAWLLGFAGAGFAPAGLLVVLGVLASLLMVLVGWRVAQMPLGLAQLYAGVEAALLVALGLILAPLALVCLIWRLRTLYQELRFMRGR